MKIRISDHFTYPRLFRFVIPSVLTMVFTSIYGVVDGYFVSNYTGKTAFAAINLIMPFIMVLGGMGFMIGTGGTALVARVMGEQDKPRALNYFSMMVEFTVILGAALSVLGLVMLEPVARFFGATDDMMADCLLYGRINILFTTAFMLQNVFQSFLIAAEKPKLGLRVTLAAGITNMALDWLFVGWFRWGISGAAAATVISQCVGGFIPLVYFLRPNDSLLRLRWAKLELRPILKACGNGSSELMNNVSSSVVSMAFNWQLLRYAGENGVAAYGVLMYVCFIFVAVFVGYSVGTAPIVSYHYGAGDKAELRNLLRKSLTVSLSLGALMLFAGETLAGPLSRLYVGYDATLCDMTIGAFRIFSLSFLLCGANIFASSFFTALNNGAVSAIISFLRTLVFELLSVFVLPLAWGLNGIWAALSVAELGAFVVSIGFLLSRRKRYGY